jgi:hypothetical protein
MKRLAVLAVGVAALAVILVPGASAAGVANPGFESGFSGWSTLSSGEGGWGINTGTASGADVTLAPWQGARDALFDQGGPSSGLLYQSFVVPTDGVVQFAYTFVNDGGEWDMETDPWDISGEGNQWVSIDVLYGDAAPDSFDSGDIVETVARPSGGDATETGGWVPVTLNLSAFAGDTLILRVATANTLSNLPVWFDGPGGADSGPPYIRPPERVAYCSVPGNTNPDGSPIPVGTFLDLQRDQPKTDPHYTGAGVANFVQGLGLTCDQIPIGFTHQGFAGHLQNVPEDTYPFYGPPAPLTSPASFRARY